MTDDAEQLLPPDDHDELDRERDLRNGRRRGNLEVIKTSEEIAAASSYFGDRAAKAMLRLRHMRDHLCPGCQSGSVQHRTCQSRNIADLDHGIDDEPLCKHASDADKRKREKERASARFNRLLVAGCRDEKILAIVPRSVHVCRPPFAWFTDPFDAQRHDEATGVVDRIAKRTYKYSATVIAGVSGSGKSVIAAWGLAGVERGGVWIPATLADDFELWREAVRKARDSSFVVIDDLGRERDGQPVENMKTLVTDLLDASTPLVLTTNIADPDLFAQRFCTDPDPAHISGTRLRERMHQKSDWLSCGNENLRAHARERDKKED